MSFHECETRLFAKEAERYKIRYKSRPTRLATSERAAAKRRRPARRSRSENWRRGAEGTARLTSHELANTLHESTDPPEDAFALPSRQSCPDERRIALLHSTRQLAGLAA